MERDDPRLNLERFQFLLAEIAEFNPGYVHLRQ
jgi:hypothetical protein